MRSIGEQGVRWRRLALTLGWALLSLGQPTSSGADVDGGRLKGLVPKILVHKPDNVSDTGAGLVVGRSPDRKSLFILTAFHVIEEAESLEVVFHDLQFRKFVGLPFERFDEALDLAVVEVRVDDEESLPVDPSGCEYLQSSRLREGDELIALGHPLDLEWQISLDHRVLSHSDDADDRKLRITLEAIERGSSGGPLFDQEGALVGTVTRMSPNYALAVKAEAAVSVLEHWGVPFACTPVALPATLVITSESGAQVELDGGEPVTIGREALTIEDLKAGAHALVVSKAGFNTETLEVELKSGEVRLLAVPLKAVATGRFLVLVSSIAGGGDPGVEVAETTLLGGLARRRFSVVDRNQIEQIRANDSQMEAVLGGDAVRLAAIGKQHGAEVVVVGGLQSEAQRSLGKFYTGRASLALRCYRASTGQYLWAETLRVGGGDVPGELEPSQQQARTAASEAVAELGAQAIVDKVVPLLEPGALVLAGETEDAVGAEGEYSEVVVRGADIGEYRQIRDLLERHPGVEFGEMLQLVAKERLVLSIRFEGDLTALAVDLDGSPVGGRRLRLAEAEAKRLIFELETK